MAQKSGILKWVWVLVIGGGLFIVVNLWLMKQVDVTVGSPVEKVAVMRPEVVMSNARIPTIDPKNDPLAPVGPAALSPQDYLQRRTQSTSDEKEYEMPHPGAILLQ